MEVQIQARIGRNGLEIARNVEERLLVYRISSAQTILTGVGGSRHALGLGVMTVTNWRTMVTFLLKAWRKRMGLNWRRLRS